ncbi:vicilin-like seed storage protein At2g18540 [Cynara cardunculus var. scolymus]|uniref:vicilin-like seed storage protein At2g18540 n=1 Tax=Cynara cardunculus var. scolymus TaxID=59895 RepID=UPI000D624D97|nr:vicilin-like seed storage protein At2g18540 [Cynara cardunculus var. scolymus]
MKSKEIRRAYKRTSEIPGPVSRTPLRIGTAEEEKRTEDTSMPQAEGETMRAGVERIIAEEERERVQQEREKETKREGAKKKKVEREKKKKEGAERAEQERLTKIACARAEEEWAEKDLQVKIARLREEAKQRVEEKARQTLVHSSSPNPGDDQDHYDDAARSSQAREVRMRRKRVKKKRSAMNALGDRLLQKVADFTVDFNSKATIAVKNINDTLARFNYRSDDEVRSHYSRRTPQDHRGEPSKRRRLDDDEDPDESHPQNRQEGANLPTTTLSTIPLDAPSAPSSSAPCQQGQSRQSRQSQQVADNAEALHKGKMPMASEAEPAGLQKTTEVIDLLSAYRSDDSDLDLSSSTEYAMDMAAPSTTTQQEEEVVAMNVDDPSLLHIPIAIPLEEVIIAAPPPHPRTHSARVPA